jgi:hypothetical protein
MVFRAGHPEEQLPCLCKERFFATWQSQQQLKAISRQLAALFVYWHYSSLLNNILLGRKNRESAYGRKDQLSNLNLSE